MKDLILHKKTRADINDFVTKPSHSLLLLGPAGAGKRHLACAVIAKVLKMDPEVLQKYPYFLELTSSNSNLGIEQVRQAQAFVRLKTSGTDSLRRAILIPEAQTMTVEAQNALLKLLEEPPADTLIVLTATTSEELLPTVVSRAQAVFVRPPDVGDIRKHFIDKGADEERLTAALHLSGGYVGLTTDILSNSDSQYLQHIDTVKKVLAMTKFDRLAYINEFSKQGQDLPSLLWAIKTICRAAMAQAASKGNIKSLDQWRRGLQAVLAAQDGLRHNPQSKLLLSDLLLNL